MASAASLKLKLLERLDLMEVVAMHQLEMAGKCKVETHKLLQEAQSLTEDFRSSKSPSDETFLQTAGKLDGIRNRLDLAISKTSEEAVADEEETREKPPGNRLSSSVSQKLSSIVNLTGIEGEEILKTMKEVSELLDRASQLKVIVLDLQDLRGKGYKVYKEKILELSGLETELEIKKYVQGVPEQIISFASV